MPKLFIKAEVKELIDKILAADVIKVDDIVYPLIKHPKADRLLEDHFEDYEQIIDTSYHVFSWWEVREDSTKLNNREWKIGENVVSFYTLLPA